MPGNWKRLLWTIGFVLWTIGFEKIPKWRPLPDSFPKSSGTCVMKAVNNPFRFGWLNNGYWDRFSVYLTLRDEHMRELEALILRIVEPAGNKVKGKFSRSKNLIKTLNRQLVEIDMERRNALLGRRRRRLRTRGGKVLEGAVTRSKTLRGERGQWEYRATLRPDGQIKYDKLLYESPNAAAGAATGGRCNGWGFWKYRDRRGEWVPLGTLKRG